MAKLSYQEKQDLPKSDFAIKPKNGQPGKYPLPDLAHARNALARVSQFGTVKEKQLVTAAVYKKFPQLKPAAD